MKTILVQKDSKVLSAIAVRRSVSLLAQIGTRDAIQLLDELARREPKSEMSRFASAARDRLRIPEKP